MPALLTQAASGARARAAVAGDVLHRLAVGAHRRRPPLPLSRRARARRRQRSRGRARARRRRIRPAAAARRWTCRFPGRIRSRRRSVACALLSVPSGWEMVFGRLTSVARSRARWPATGALQLGRVTSYAPVRRLHERRDVGLVDGDRRHHDGVGHVVAGQPPVQHLEAVELLVERVAVEAWPRSCRLRSPSGRWPNPRR